MLSFRMLAFILMMAETAPSALADKPELKAWIELTELDGQLQLDSMASADQADTLTYTISLERISDAGTSSTRQGGRVEATAGEPVVLSRNRVNAMDNGTLRISLEVVDQDGESASDLIEIGNP